MRATIGDVVRHPSWVGSWLYELPARRRWWWKQLLFAPGGGWLRWKGALIRYPGGDYYDPPDEGWVFPPARRLWIMLRRHSLWPWATLRDPDREYGR